MKTQEENIRLYEQAQQIRKAANAELHRQATGASTRTDPHSFVHADSHLGSRSDCGKKARSHKT